MGVRYIILNEALAKAQKLPVNYGALIIRETLGGEAVVKGSAAAQAGLKEYDIILEVDGEKITEENPLAEILARKKIGDEIKMNVLREGKKITLKTKLEERK